MSEGSEVYMTSVPTSVKNCSDLKNYFSKDRLISSTVRKVSGQLTK
jgi:hypothetical protein